MNFTIICLNVIAVQPFLERCFLLLWVIPWGGNIVLQVTSPILTKFGVLVGVALKPHQTKFERNISIFAKVMACARIEHFSCRPFLKTPYLSHYLSYGARSCIFRKALESTFRKKYQFKPFLKSSK